MKELRCKVKIVVGVLRLYETSLLCRFVDHTLWDVTARLLHWGCGSMRWRECGGCLGLPRLASLRPLFPYCSNSYETTALMRNKILP